MTTTQVSLDFLRDDNAHTQLPSSVQTGSTVFPVTDFGTDNTNGFANLTSSWTGNSLVGTLDHTTNNWVFVNDVQFTGSTVSATPGPGTIGLTLGVLIAAVTWGRKRSYLKR